jgi:hypothetical protein
MMSTHYNNKYKRPYTLHFFLFDAPRPSSVGWITHLVIRFPLRLKMQHSPEIGLPLAGIPFPHLVYQDHSMTWWRTKTLEGSCKTSSPYRPEEFVDGTTRKIGIRKLSVMVQIAQLVLPRRHINESYSDTLARTTANFLIRTRRWFSDGYMGIAGTVGTASKLARPPNALRLSNLKRLHQCYWIEMILLMVRLS